ncbi:RDD family protein [Magnetospirillum molischianum]|uniref:Predicted membrane protein/domain n=1 Tax=Magnetospirillum molischianum DSM 120 TaxID=1150626 RepID=H8FXL8_MAGML|nr:RDD family protein [Magnetospirillum molischianum]CCG43106.1 Predicted membrane protein/domain [Magnetospirillum molischianum DSM 120]
MSVPPTPTFTSPTVPEWGDPWRYPIYYLGVTPRRIYAYCLDLVVVGLLWLMVFIGCVILGALSLGLLMPILGMVLAAVPISYHTLTIAGPRSATFGMRVAGLRVMSVAPGAEIDGGRPTILQALIQTVAFYASLAMTGSLILLVALFNPRRRTAHDFLAGTVVVNDPRQWRGSGP